MIIDKKFSIITYAGSLPLNLMTKDPGVAGNPIKSNEWDKMIQAVDTIYGTQKADNTIPVFWTKRFSTIDNFGNTSYKYAPHPQSTLTKLDSKGAYYIVLRDSSSIPLKIPSNGSLVLGYADTEDLPFVSPPLLDVALDQDSFEYTFKPRIINLKPYETYSYSWKTISSNWPVAVNSLSGILKPASNTGTINSSMTFCPTTGSCSSNVLPHVIPENCSLEQIKDPYITLQLSVVSEATGAESLSDQFTITCKDCLPKPRIDIVSTCDGCSQDGHVIINEPTDEDPQTASYSFDLTFNNLEPGKIYSYAIETIRADWPIVYVTPISGIFENKSSYSVPISNKIFFCPATGLCPSNGSSIPNYIIPDYPKFLNNEAEYQVFIRASLTPDYSPVCSFTSAIYSNIARITYKKS